MVYQDRLDELAQRHADKDAIVDPQGTLTYLQLRDHVAAASSWLRGIGLGPGHMVGLTIADERQHLVASLALLDVGAAHITLATHDALELRSQLAHRAGVTHLLLESGSEAVAGCPVVAWAPPTRPVDGAGPPRGERGDGRLLLKTSGTTGGINIVPFTGEQLARQSARHAEYAGERLLRLASIEHNNSKRHRLYCVFSGGTNVFRPRGAFDVIGFARSAQVTCLDISRMHASDLAAMHEAASLSHVKVRTGGSAIPWEVRRDVQEKVTRSLYVRYATTEFGAISMAGPGDHDADEASGRPLPGVELEIVDPDGRQLPPGRTGEIRLRAAGMAQGYLGDDEQTARRFRGGWFYPGDTGRLRPDGQLVVEGRLDDMIIMNGLNIFPAEIEKVLQRHPAVATAAAFPMASRVHGQIPVAAVELRAGAQASAAQLQAWARDHLALRTPRKVLVLPALPRNAQGKILKRELLQLVQPGTS